MQANEPINNIAVDLSLAVLREPMARDAFVAQLQVAQLAMFTDQPLPRLRQLRFNDLTASIKHFTDFINAEVSPTINPSEALLDKFLDSLLKFKGNDKHKYCLTIRNNTRNLINHFPPAVLQRPLVNGKRKRRLTRFDHLSKTSRDFLNDFLKDGRILNRKRHCDKRILSAKLLAPRLREYIVWTASNYLKVIGKTCLLKVTPKDAEVFIQFYEAQNKRDLALKYLAELQGFFLNMVGKGLIRKNPVEKYNERQPSRINDDFVMPDQMEILKDLSTVDFNDIFNVRDRMLTFALFYDFCLRVGETALLKVADFTWDGKLVGITLRSEIQKGQNKPKVTLYNCFDESRQLIQAYLGLRKKYLGERDIDAFLISDKKTRLVDSGVREAVERHCRKLGITTRKGDCPTPHEFRGTFATINIDRLGLCLSPYFIQGRLRHSDLATTIKIYVKNNPLLARVNHIENVQGGRERSSSFSPTTPDGIELPTKGSQPTDIIMPEAEAMSVLRPLGIVAHSLRQYATTRGVSETKNNQALYSRSFILDLSKNWLPKQKVMKQLHFGVSRWHMWKKTRGIKPVVIGKRSFVRASDVFNELKK